MVSRVIETDDKVFIEGIPPMKYGEQMDNTFVRSMQLSLNAMGEILTYDYLMGLSGAAFRLHFDPKWCPSSADATVGFDVSGEIFKSLGYQLQFVKINHSSFNDIKSLYKMIKIQIDLGRPIVSINLKGNMDWGIITGYLKNEPGILCRTYYDESDAYSVASRAPWLNFFVGEKNNGLSTVQLFDHSLRIAVKLAKTKKFDEYFNGFYAYEKWIDRLNKAAQSFDQKDFVQIIEIHFIILNTLLDARRSAVKYLSASKKVHRIKNIDRIIGGYSEIVQLLESSHSFLIQNADINQAKQIEEMIKKQSDMLLKVLNVEKKVIQLLEKEINT